MRSENMSDICSCFVNETDRKNFASRYGELYADANTDMYSAMMTACRETVENASKDINICQPFAINVCTSFIPGFDCKNSRAYTSAIKKICSGIFEGSIDKFTIERFDELFRNLFIQETASVIFGRLSTICKDRRRSNTGKNWAYNSHILLTADEFDFQKLKAEYELGGKYIHEETGRSLLAGMEYALRVSEVDKERSRTRAMQMSESSIENTFFSFCNDMPGIIGSEIDTGGRLDALESKLMHEEQKLEEKSMKHFGIAYTLRQDKKEINNER